MGLISRVYRFINGTANDGSEVDSEFQLVFDAINGGLDNANISSSGTPIAVTKVAEIPPDRVLDHADDEATFNTIFPPGDTGTPILPTTLEGELERLRYRVGANRRYIGNLFYMDNSGPTATAAAWYEPPIVGPNLLPNPGFEVQSGVANSAPDGWSLIGDPATIAVENPAHLATGLEKRSLNIVTDAANEGISVSIAGLKTSTKYLIGMRYSITNNGTTPGTIRLTTTGALATGDYQNLSLTDGAEASSTVNTLQGIVKPTATPDPIVVRIDATESGADWNIHDVWMYELADGTPRELPSIPTQTKTSTTPITYPTTWSGGGAWRTDTITALSLSQYVPFRGYRMTYEVTVPFTALDAGSPPRGARVYGAIQVNIDGGGANTVSGPVLFESVVSSGDLDNLGSTFNLKYTLDNPTPGSTYAFTFLLGVYDDSLFEQVSSPPTVAGVLMESRAVLTMERL